MNLLKNLLLVTVLAAAGFFGEARAQVTPLTETTEFDVTITITASCTITATPISFGQVVRSTADTAQGTLTVNCSATKPYIVSLDGGLNPDGPTITATSRRMANANGFVPYGLYSDAAHTTVWGEDPDDVDGTGSGTDQLLTVYAQVTAAATNAPRGDYIDTVTATITY